MMHGHLNVKICRTLSHSLWIPKITLTAVTAKCLCTRHTCNNCYWQYKKCHVPDVATHRKYRRTPLRHAELPLFQPKGSHLGMLMWHSHLSQLSGCVFHCLHSSFPRYRSPRCLLCSARAYHNKLPYSKLNYNNTDSLNPSVWSDVHCTS